MTLPASGQITLTQVNVELGEISTQTINMGSAAVRDLFGIASGVIAMSDGYGKSSEITVTLKSSAFNDTGAVTLPGSLSNGDMLLFGTYSQQPETFASPPSGWTALFTFGTDGDSDGVAVLWAKIVDGTGTESGSITCFGSNRADGSFIAVLESGISSFGTLVDFNSQSTGGTPADQVVNASTLGTLPFLVFGMYAASNAMPIADAGFSGATADFTVGDVTADNVYFKGKFYAEGSSPADITVSMVDVNKDNCLFSGIIPLT